MLNCNDLVQTHYYRDIKVSAPSPEQIAIEELQKATEELKETTTQLEKATTDLEKSTALLTNRKYIFIGDSYASGEIGSSWIDNCRAVLGTDNTYKYAKSGAGFTIANNTFQMLIEKAAADITDKTVITDVVVGGGYNDAVYSGSGDTAKIQAMNTFVQYVRTTFPNAKVHFAFIGWCIIPDNLEMLAKECRLWIDFANGTVGTDYLNNIQFALHRTDYFKGTHMNPMFHPNPAGNLYLSKCMLNCLETGSCNVYHKIILKGTGVGYTLRDEHATINITVENGTTIFECCHTYTDEVDNVFIQGYSTNNPRTVGGFNASNLITLDNFIGNNNNYAMTTTEAVLEDSAGKLYRIKAGMGVGTGKIYISPEINTETEDGGYPDIVNFAFKGFKIVFDTMDCC